jgi:hypothetical protein
MFWPEKSGAASCSPENNGEHFSEKGDTWLGRKTIEVQSDVNTHPIRH